MQGLHDQTLIPCGERSCCERRGKHPKPVRARICQRSHAIGGGRVNPWRSMACKPIGISRAELFPYFNSKSANGGMRGAARLPFGQCRPGETATERQPEATLKPRKTKGLARANVLTLVFTGAAGRIRTHDPLVRSQSDHGFVKSMVVHRYFAFPL